ncbi:hypothetical protein ERAG_04571 [Escherichia coli R424]|nr:conserved hypothetical protein [Escherichia coli M718]OSM04608.1 hypothetical protein ERAG_04571 [Escherichia coli R424]
MFEVIGFRNVDMAELLIHTLTERVAITEGHLFRVAFAIFFQLSQAAEFQDVPLFPGVFFLPGNKKRVRRGFDVLRGPALCSLRYSPSPV